jgi:hypothetical protein
MKFAELRRTRLSVSEENERALRLLPELVRANGWLVWQPTPASSAADRLVLGVVNWSLYDLALLDVIVAHGSDSLGNLEVFDIDQGWRDGHVAKHFPDFTPAHGSPIAALWQRGSLADAAYGWRARQLVGRFLGGALVWNPQRWQFELIWGKTTS